MEKKSYNDVWEMIIRGDLTQIEIRVFVKLYSFNKDGRIVNRSLRQIARGTGLTVQQISKATSSLQKKGVLMKYQTKVNGWKVYELISDQMRNDPEQMKLNTCFEKDFISK